MDTRGSGAPAEDGRVRGWAIHGDYRFWGTTAFRFRPAILTSPRHANFEERVDHSWIGGFPSSQDLSRLGSGYRSGKWSTDTPAFSSLPAFMCAGTDPVGRRRPSGSVSLSMLRVQHGWQRPFVHARNLRGTCHHGKKRVRGATIPAIICCCLGGFRENVSR